MKNVILFSGHMQTGKNQFATYLQNELSRRKYNKVAIESFAYGVKNGCKNDLAVFSNFCNDLAEEIKANVYNFVNDRDEIFKKSVLQSINQSVNKLRIRDENWFENKTELTRILLQIYGTDIFRKNVDENWWAKQLQQRIIQSPNEFILVTDARFENEITIINDPQYQHLYNTITIRIERNMPNTNPANLHPSETSLDNWTEWNYIIDNNKSLDELKQSAHMVCNEILNESDEYIGLITRSSEDALLLLCGQF